MNDKVLGALLFILQNERYMAVYVIQHDNLIFSEITETSKTTEQQQLKHQPFINKHLGVLE